MHKNIKIRLYPTVKQKIMLDNHFNAFRFCYNLSLEYSTFLWNNYKKSVSGYDLQNELFNIRKETPWILKCKAECIREAGLRVNESLNNFFKGKGYPKFKSKRGVQSFCAHQNVSTKAFRLKFYGNFIKFKTSTRDSDILNSSKIKSVYFKKDKVDNYYAVCVIEFHPQPTKPVSNSILGIDLGLKDLIITSDGAKYSNNEYLKSTAFKIANFQRRLARTQKGSSNGNKLRIKIAKLHQKASRQREHHYHQITNELIRDNQTIVLETLKIKNMVKNHNVARSINDASWGLIVQQLEYKSKWYGRTIIRLDAFYPSTKTCSSCGNIKEISLSERVYKCDCGLSLDRDINAAINIRNAGLKIPGVLMEGVGYEPNEVRSNSLIINN